MEKWNLLSLSLSTPFVKLSEMALSVSPYFLIRTIDISPS